MNGCVRHRSTKYGLNEQLSSILEENHQNQVVGGNNAQEGDECFIDEHLGFIKFGSRVDVYLPLDTEVLASLGQRTVGNQTIIARLSGKKA